MLLAHRVGKHTKKRKKRLDRARAKLREKEKKKKKPDMFDTAALHLLHDPQGFAERLMTQVEKTTERFEVPEGHTKKTFEYMVMTRESVRERKSLIFLTKNILDFLVVNG